MTLVALLAALLVLPGCGDDDSNDTGPVDGSDEAKLLVSQANADLEIFCLRAKTKSTGENVRNVAFISAANGVDVLVSQTRENPELEVPLSSKRPNVPLQTVVRDNINRLKRGCGKDGRLMAARLESAAQ
jgi:hypothetical protein